MSRPEKHNRSSRPGITLRNVAQAAGVSVDTASRALRGANKGAYPKSNRNSARIRGIAERLGYRPNTSARSMRQGKFGSISLILSSAGRGRSTLPQTLLHGLCEALDEHNLHLNVTPLSDRQLTDPQFLPKIAREWTADGVVVNYNRSMPERVEAMIERIGLPSVWVNSRRNHNCVYPDDFDACKRLTEDLFRRGHRQIAYADLNYSFSSESDVHYSRQDRYAGYVAAMEQLGLPPHVIDNRDEEWKNWAMHRFWTYANTTCLASGERPTAVIGYSVHEVDAFLLAATALGLRVPEDLVLAAFSDEPLRIAGLRVPTMIVPNSTVGRRAVDVLRRCIDGAEPKVAPVNVEFEYDMNYGFASTHGTPLPISEMLAGTASGTKDRRK